MKKAKRRQKAKPQDVFISHAVADKPVVDAFVDLLDTGLELSPKRIFCSSLDGMGIPSGADFKEYIRERIESPTVVLLFLSPNYFASQFCLSELGASWVLSHKIIPILIPPSGYADMKAVLQGVHGRKIDDESALAEIRDELVSELDLGDSIARWDAKKRKFLTDLPAILDSLENPTIVRLSEYQDLEKKYDDSVEQLERTLGEIDTLKKRIKKIKKLKNAKEVAAFEVESSSEWELFEKTCKEAAKALGKLPSIVGKVLFYELTNREYPGLPDRYEEEAIREAEENDYIEINEGVYANRDDSRVSVAIDALTQLAGIEEGFVGEKQVSGDFFEQYAEQFEHQPIFSSKRFWETHFDL